MLDRTELLSRPGLRVALTLLVATACTTGFLVLYPLAGPAAGLLGIVASGVVGAMWGLRLGVLGGVLSLPITVWLYKLVGLTTEGPNLPQVLSALVSIWIGGAAGSAYDAAQRLRRQTVELNAERIALEEQVIEREMAEQALRDARDDLERRVAERTAELMTANTLLEQQLAERRRAEAAEREQRMLAEALRDTAAVLASTLDLDQLLDQVMANMAGVVPHDAAALMLLAGDEVYVSRSVGYAERGLQDYMATMRFSSANMGTLACIRATGQPFVVADTQAFPGWIVRPETAWIRSSAHAPVRVRGEIAGLLTVDSATTNFFNATHAERLKAFADQVGVAIENARLYAEVRSHATMLEERVAARTAELVQRELALQAANNKLQELDRLKSQFVSNVSHELRTPLTNIKLYLSLLERGKPERQAQYLATLNREADLLTQLIEDLLDLSRLELGRVKPALVPVDLNRLIEDLVTVRGALLTDHGLELRFMARPNLPPAQADPKMLLQVLTNLMTNAMNYTQRGGVVTIRSNLLRNGSDWVTFSVNDTGPGIPVEEQAQLFNRFFRGGAAQATGVPGTGLGLAICQEIVQRHGGRITVESQPGCGSTFTVWLKPAYLQ